MNNDPANTRQKQLDAMFSDAEMELMSERVVEMRKEMRGEAPKRFTP